jgi:CheY-like chemotaxis protein
MGIGLTLVDRLVRLHGGTVSLESAGLGQGSEFIVRVPVGVSQGKARLVSVAETCAPDEIRVVLVEDNADLRALTANLLDALGCCVEVAVDGPEGVDQIVRSKPDLALIDIGLPLLDGFGVARQVREKIGDSIMLVAVTGYSRDQDREHARDAGFDSFVTKPLGADTIRDLLDKVRRSRSQASAG